MCFSYKKGSTNVNTTHDEFGETLRKGLSWIPTSIDLTPYDEEINDKGNE